MLSSLEALEKAEAGTSGTRSTVFQPKVKPRSRKPGGSGSVSDTKHGIDIVTGAKDTSFHYDAPNASVNEAQSNVASSSHQYVAAKDGEINVLAHEQDANEDALPNAATIASAQASHHFHGKVTEQREGLDILITDVFTSTRGSPSVSSRSEIQLSILESTTGIQSAEFVAITPENLPTSPLLVDEADLWNELQADKVHKEKGGFFSKTAPAVEQSTVPINNGEDGSKHAEKKNQKKKIRKRKLPHRTSQHKRRVEKIVEITASDPTHLTMKQIISWAEARERKKIKENASKEKDPVIPTLSSQNKVNHPVRAEKMAGMAPQVQIIDGKIVINEQSLTISANAASKDDLETYRRVDENLSKLNYHSYMNKPRTERWTSEETDLFYKAVRQFGTDFALIQNLFPGRSRRQIKAKFKKEDRLNPFRMNTMLQHRSKDYVHYEEVIDMLKASEKTDQADFFDYQLDAYTADPSSRQNGSTMIEEAATLDPKNSENTEALQGVKENIDSSKPDDVSCIVNNEELCAQTKISSMPNANRRSKHKSRHLNVDLVTNTELIEETHMLDPLSSYQDTQFDNPLGSYN